MERVKEMVSIIDKLNTSEVHAKRVSCRANSPIFSEMDAPRGMYVIESGEVRILKRIPDTNKEIDLATFGPNEFFGEMSLLTGRPHSAKAVAITDCTLWFLDEKGLMEALNKSPEFSLMMLKGLAKRLTDMNEKTRDIFSQLKDFSERLEDLSALRHAIVP
ncbi:MAG TPA: Crp/Fnr family transcriptional regulator [Candidatus Hypogeohydataceae bacterium YC40]